MSDRAVDKYAAQARYISEAEDWFSMYRAKYGGGGGGVGSFRQVVVGVDIYFQPSDGAKNYHPIPHGCGCNASAIGHYLNLVALDHMPEMIMEALERMRAQQRLNLVDAIEENNRLLREAGIEPGGVK